MRRSATCETCGEHREMATKTACFACYRRHQRDLERRRDGTVDRHNPGLRRGQKKLIRGFSQTMTGLAELGVSREDILQILERLQPYLEPVAQYLQNAAIPRPVNSEHAASPFTVHEVK